MAHRVAHIEKAHRLLKEHGYTEPAKVLSAEVLKERDRLSEFLKQEVYLYDDVCISGSVNVDGVEDIEKFKDAMKRTCGCG